MTSEIAKGDIEAMWQEGLKPTVEDIVRLNALGLKLEYAQKKAPADSTEYLPRVAAISETVSFRQPTIAHEIWMQKVERLIKDDDLQSLLAIKAFALSRPHTDLPDPDDVKTLKVVVQEYADTLGEYTRDQIYAALEYVIFGPSPTVGEHPPVGESEREMDGYELEDWKYCAAAGVLHEGVAALWGASVGELERMTRRQVQDLKAIAYHFHGFDTTPGIRRAQGQYFDTLGEIRERLTKEIDNG